MNNFTSSFEFDLGEQVMIKLSGERGTIDAVAEYKNGLKQYFVVYLTNSLSYARTWFSEEELEHIV